MIRAAVVAVIATIAAGCGGASGSVQQEAIPDPLDRVSAQQLFDRAGELVAARDYIRAEQYYLAAIERGMPEQQVIGPLVGTCVRSSRFSTALRYAEPYLERHPEEWSLRLLVATLLMSIGDVAEARTHLLRIVEDEPTQAAPVYMLAVLSRDALHDPDATTQWFQRYLEIAPEGEHAAEARGAIAHPIARVTEERAPASAPATATTSSSSSSSSDATPAVGVTGAPARPVRLPSHETEDASGAADVADVDDEDPED